MSKKSLALLITLTLLFALLLATIIFSFTFLKKNTDELIKTQRDKLITLINVPNAVPPSNPTYNSVTYSWEMETPQKEVATASVVQTTGLIKADRSVLVILEKTPGGDASVFEKVLPAVIADKEVLKAAFSDEKVSNLENGQTGFKKASIERDLSSGKVVKVVWEFDKNSFGEKSTELYGKLNKPELLIKILYAVQNIIIIAFSTQ